MDGLLEENRILRRNLKRAKQVLEEKDNEVRAKQKYDAEREKAGLAGRNSDADSHSFRDTDAVSMASVSAVGGYGSVKVDIKKVEMINANVLQILTSKTPFEAMLQLTKTFKQALKNVSRCTVFIINRYLQAYVFKGQGH